MVSIELNTDHMRTYVKNTRTISISNNIWIYFTQTNEGVSITQIYDPKRSYHHLFIGRFYLRKWMLRRQKKLKYKAGTRAEFYFARHLKFHAEGGETVKGNILKVYENKS